MTDPESGKRALAALAGGRVATEEDRLVIALAAAAVYDLDLAATFVERVGRKRLATAVDRAELGTDPDLARTGRRAQTTFNQYQQVARGATTPID